MRIIFMGTPAFAVPSLEALVHGGFPPLAVVTRPDTPRGRGRRVTSSAVKEAAVELGIDRILQPQSPKDPSFAAALRELDPDIIAVVAFRILPRAVFETARVGAFALHASLLPSFRGAAPIRRAVMAGASVTGVTTFFLESKVDTGNVILRWPTVLGPDETGEALHDRLMRLGSRAMLETTRRIAKGRARAHPQDGTQATRAPKIFQHDARVPWDRSATQVHNHCRGLSSRPGAWTLHHAQRLKILETRVTTGCGEPGTVLTNRPELCIACGSGAVKVLRIQQVGRRPMDAAAFLNGYALPPGAQLH